MRQQDEAIRRTLIQDYAGLTRKYIHARDTADGLLDLVAGNDGWRTCTRRIGDDDTLKPFSPTVFRKHVVGVDPLLFDYAWNHLDQTQYLHWSVYHIMTDWVLPPDAKGFGGMNVGVQEVPASGGPMHHGLLDVVFATWDDPRAFCGFPLTGESGLLMRFWNYDRAADAFTLRSAGPIAALLLQWNTVVDGVELWTTPLTRDPALQRDDITFSDGDIAVAMPHENEESSSWGMAIRDLARRHAFDPAGYHPVWRLTADSDAPRSRTFDRFAIDIATAAEIDEMPVVELQRAMDTLWQRYLGVKMLTDFALRHKVRAPSELPAPLAKLYEDFPIVDG